MLQTVAYLQLVYMKTCFWQRIFALLKRYNSIMISETSDLSKVMVSTLCPQKVVTSFKH